MFYKVYIILLLIVLITLYRYEFQLDDVEQKQFTIEKRKYILSEDELKTTNLINIQPKGCNNYQPIAVFIHSAAKYFSRRRTLRNTWVSDVKQHNISVYFVIGVSNDSNVEELIKSEYQSYGDLIQFGFIDNYYNNTLKAISLLRWIDNYCTQTQYILKTDDDVMVDIHKILEKLTDFKTGLTGYLFKDPDVKRQPYHKWNMPEEYYPDYTYPDYLNGPAYIMTNNIIKDLLRTIDGYLGFVLDIDDVFVTGIIAEMAGIERYSTTLIRPYGCNNVCALMFSIAITYDCKSDDIITNFYTDWKLTTQEQCKHPRSQFDYSIFLFVFIILFIIYILIVTPHKKLHYKQVNLQNV